MTASIKSAINSASESNEISYNDTTSQLGATNVQEAIEKTNERIKETQMPPVEYTMLASKWQGNKYTFEETYPFSQYTIYVCGCPSTATQEQRSAFSSAELASVLNDQSVDALGIKPTIDIPVVLEVVKKWQ